MKVIKSHKIIYVDVDNTLILWDYEKYGGDLSGLVTITDTTSGISAHGLPHLRHIELMREFKARGHTVVVWSAGGWEWAERAIKALNIEQLVDVVLSKPDWFIDDLQANAFMERPIFLDPMNPLKDKRSWETEDED